MTPTVQVFLMAFGAVLALIGVVVFFLLAWFKETTGQDHHNAIKILQAEFRFSNPALVIFAGGLILMIAPIFVGQNSPISQPPTPTPAPTATPAPDPGPTLALQPTPAGLKLVDTSTAIPVPPTTEPSPTAIPEPPTPTPTATPEPPTPTPTAVPIHPLC
jgi:hypothetical protein